jgi:hypothetical protein
MPQLDPFAARPKPVVKVVHASIVLVVSLSYLSYVFRLFDAGSWNSGLGDWLDPYFINALLEHWYRSATNLSDPSSPAMYFPAQKTLGYSHGLVLYAPFYLPLRLFLHPFQAYTLTLFVVIETGILCLYLLLRKLGLSFIESLLLSALFFSSQNVVNGQTGVWSQRASVFLIPPILLLLLVSARMRPRRARLLLAGFAAFLSTLMYVQDFPTAHLALLLGTLFGAAVAFVDGRLGERIAKFRKSQPRAFRLTLTIVALASAWACFVLTFGGVDVQILGARFRSHSWRRPALIALVALMALIGLSVRTRAGPRIRKPNPWLLALGIGAAAGAIVFLWVYLGAYREHRAFPEDQLLTSLLVRDPSRWRSPLDFVRDLGAYDTLRSFALVFVVGTLAWIPRFRVEKRTRIYCLWFLAISFVVLLIPLRFPELSLWRVFFQWLPGFGVIRDPKRIIHLYELAVVLVVALFLARLPAKSASRISITLFLLVLLVAERNREVFLYKRPIEVYERWVAAPIAIDPACRCFYIKGASEKYMSRFAHMWSLYGIDSIFVSLNHTIPTLNGYSAWYPDGWNLLNPQEADYPDRVKRWIDAHGLTGVCEFDIEARTMTPRIP